MTICKTDIEKVEFWNYLRLDHIDLEHLLYPDTQYCCGELFTMMCGFGNHVIISHFWNTGNKEIMKLV